MIIWLHVVRSSAPAMTACTSPYSAQSGCGGSAQRSSAYFPVNPSPPLFISMLGCPISSTHHRSSFSCYCKSTLAISYVSFVSHASQTLLIMEAVGLGVGVAGLAGLAASVQDAKGNFDSYKNAKFESQPLLAQRYADRILLQQWSESVGYSNNELQDGHHSALDDPKVREAVDKIVQCIQNIDINTDGAPLDGESSSARIMSRQQGPRGNTRGPVRLEKYHESMPRKAKWTWAFQDKRKVSEQTQNVAALLQRLHDLVPPPQASSGTVQLPMVHVSNSNKIIGVPGVEILPNLIQQFSIAMEKAIAQDMERRIGVYFRS